MMAISVFILILVNLTLKTELNLPQIIMAKGQNVQKAAKKEPAKTPKEKKEEKRDKKPKYD